MISRLTTFAAVATLSATPLVAQEFAATPAGMLIPAYESDGGRNIPNFRFDKHHTAGGHFQITDTNWQHYARTLGIDLDTYPNAMSAPEQLQGQVAGKMWAERGYMPWTCCNAQLRRDLKKLNLALPTPPAPKPAQPSVPPGLSAHEWHEISANGVITSVSFRPHEWHEITAANTSPKSEDKHE